MTQINGTSTSTGNLPAARPAAVAPGDTPAPKLATDGHTAAKDTPPTDVKRAMKVIAGLELPAKPRIMFRDATRDAWVRDAAQTLVRAEKVLDILRDAALDPRTPVSDADWTAAKTKVKALGDAIAAADKHGVRIDAFEPMLAPHRDALRAAAHYPAAPGDPKARAAWKAEGEKVLARGREAERALDELAADTGVDPWAVKLLNGGTISGPGGDHILGALEDRLHAPPPGKLDGLSSFIKSVGAIAQAVEIAPNGQLRERRR